MSMSMRTNPFEEIERFFDRMSRQFEEDADRWESGEPFGGWSKGVDAMAVDLAERDDEFVVTVDLPGFTREDVGVQVTDHTLRIHAEREEQLDDEEANYIRRERRHSSASRTIRLPEEVETENVKAEMTNGVLTVSLPRLTTEEAREIEIE